MSLKSGLKDRMDIIKLTDGDSGFGTSKAVEEVVESDVRCRFTIQKQKVGDERQIPGKGGPVMYKVTATCTVNLNDYKTTSYILRHTNAFGETSSVDYDLIFAQPQYRRNSNKLHHWMLRAELNDDGTVA